MVILQQPESFCFSSALKDVIIQSDGNINVSFSIQGQQPFLLETYSPDSEGRIYIRELGKLFIPYISKISLRETFVIGITGSGTGSITTTVLYGLTAISETAANFLSGSFLTLLNGEKITFPQQKEYLSLVVSEATTATVRASRQSGETESKTITINDLNQTVTIDVSPAVFDNPETIAYYTVSAGVRAFTYYLRRPSAPAPHFLFLNSFGVKETFIPYGLSLRENKYENQFGFFNGLYRKYAVDLVKEYKVNTGILREETADWIEELFATRDVFLLTSAEEKQEITIMEATVKRSSARDALPAYEFKYRLSDSNQMEYNTIENRIFDDTYDYTFN
ncbi:MAG: hypothetical protein LBP72_06615 [Dysgonamonadaceae bacterium]|jgi:archaellum component FlaF (FlaF/FlaG flagellin family)|nr:hypothetical protein [Dysgonamonadaceae bacterium]